MIPSNPFAPRQYGELQKITRRVYLFRNITNSSFVIGDRGVAVIDTQVNLPSAERVLAAVRSVTDKPIRYVINTHYHWDHTNGNELFKNEGAEVVSSALTRRFMVDRAPRQKEFLSGRGFELGKDPFLPETTFDGETGIDLGGVVLRLFFAGRAESDDATAIEVAGDNLLMSGDTVMTGSFPIFGQPVWDEGLQDRQWIGAIEKILSCRPHRILPGHGPLADEADLRKLIRIQEYFLEEVGARVRKGAGIGEILADLEPRLPAWITGMPLVWGTPRYAILRVFRGLTKKENDGRLGWQDLKPSAIPEKKDVEFAGKEKPFDFLEMAREAAEGGDAALRISVLKKASQIFPGHPEILVAYADALIDASRAEGSVLEKGDFFQEAKKCWDQVLESDRHHTGALLGKGRYLTMMAYRGGDDPSAGMELLRQVSEKAAGGRTAAEAEFYLGIGFRRLGFEDKARAQFQKALALDPSFLPARIA